jgi:hypothetical protein
MKAKPRAKSKSTAKPAVAKNASKVTKKATVGLNPSAKRVKNKVTAKKKVADSGIVAAVKREAAKVTAVAEAVVEVVQEEFAKVKRGAKKVTRKKK